MEDKFSFLKEFNGRKNLEESYGDNALLLYALQLRFNMSDKFYSGKSILNLVGIVNFSFI